MSPAVFKGFTADPAAIAVKLVQLKAWFPQADISLMVTRRQVRHYAACVITQMEVVCCKPGCKTSLEQQGSAFGVRLARKGL